MALELDWPRFPCAADKSPLTKNGFKDATPDYDVASAPMVGLAIPDGYLVIDIDPRNGGQDTIRRLKREGYRFPLSRRVRTGSGGQHIYLRVPEGIELRDKLGPGVDAKRAGRGYVITPPSPGYSLEQDIPMATAPAWLIDMLRRPLRVVPPEEAHAPKYFKFDSGTEYGIAAMEGEKARLREAIPGDRNNQLNRSAFALGQLVAGGELDETAARAGLIDTAVELGWNRIEETVESGFQAGLGEPRQAPPIETVAVVGTQPYHYWVNWEIDEPEPEYYYYPVLPRNAYVLVYGATEASKSMVFVGLLAQGSHEGYKCSVYSLENPPAIDRDRLRRLRPSKENFRLTNEPLDVNDPRQFQQMIDAEREWGTDLLMIDTYSHAFASRSDDGNAKAIEFARRMRLLMHEVECTVIVVDHTGYSQVGEPRDASAKRQQVDVAIMMMREGEWVKGQPSLFSMENKKSARFANPFRMRGSIADREDRGLEIQWSPGLFVPEWRG